MWIGYSQLKHLTILLCYQVGVLVRAQNARGAVIPGGCVPCTRAGIAVHFNIAVYTLARSFDGIYSKASEYSDACFVSRYFYVCVLCSAYLLELFRGRTVWPEDLHYQILRLELLLMAG